jgi:hypothetical protein
MRTPDTFALELFLPHRVYLLIGEKRINVNPV